MKVEFFINCSFNKTAPVCEFFSNNNNVSYVLDEFENNIKTNFQFDKTDFLGIRFLNKDDDDDNIVFIKRILVDDIDLQHFIFQGLFEPIYNKSWYNKQKIKPPKIYKPCTELRHNGEWVLDINLPIWKMIMNFWINDEKLA